MANVGINQITKHNSIPIAAPRVRIEGDETNKLSMVVIIYVELWFFEKARFIAIRLAPSTTISQAHSVLFALATVECCFVAL